MYGHGSEPSVVYRYGAREPVSGLDQVVEQMQLAHRYRNSLVEIELERRREIDQALRELSPDLVSVESRLADVQAQLDAAVAALKEEQARARKKVRPPHLVSTIEALRGERRNLFLKRNELRASLFESGEWAARKAAIEEADRARRTEKRGSSGLYWGTYLIVEHAAAKFRTGRPPRFRRWDGCGHLAIQFQGGVSPEELFGGGSSKLRIRMTSGTSNASRSWAVVSWRVKSDERGNPVWAEIPAVIHRPIPADCKIKWAHLLRMRVGTHYRWEIQFVLARRAGWTKPDCASTGSVAIDVGWRMMDDGSLRVAYWRGSDGAEGELRLPADWLGEMERVRRIRSVRDRNLDEIRARLVAYLAASTPPEWLVERSQRIAQWRSANRLARLAIDWRTRRFAGDEEIYEALEAWRKRDRHLYEFEANLRDQLIARRKDLYRNFAAQIRRRYARVVLEDIDLRDFHELPEAEKPPVDGALREHVRDACLSDLRRFIQESASEVVLVDPQDTTRTCPRCGHLNVGRDGAPRVLRCGQCGAVEDQDRTASENIARRAQ